MPERIFPGLVQLDLKKRSHLLRPVFGFFSFPAAEMTVYCFMKQIYPPVEMYCFNAKPDMFWERIAPIATVCK